jgi:transcription initiation factor IIE alpha subunit
MAGFLERLDITSEELEEALQASASLRGILLGYLAERKLVESTSSRTAQPNPTITTGQARETG